MADIDRLIVSNQAFISTLLCITAKKHRMPATAIGEMQVSSIARQIIRNLGGDEDMGDEFYLTVLKPHHTKSNPISHRLDEFLNRQVSPGLLHKFNLSPSDIRTTWNFDDMCDPTVMDGISNSALECDHHSIWQKEQKKQATVQTKEPDLCDVDEPGTPIEIFKDAMFPRLSRKKEEPEAATPGAPGQAMITAPSITRAKRATKKDLEKLMEL